MLLSELRDAIENGKTAKLFIPKTHEHGLDLTIRVAKVEEAYTWQRGRIEVADLNLNLPAITTPYLKWEKLIEELRNSMQLRDTTWEECEEPIEIPQFISIESEEGDITNENE